MTMKIKGTHLFVATALLLFALFVGFDYLKSKLISSSHRVTIGYVNRYKCYVRTFNNRIDYIYRVNGKEYNGRYRSNELTTDLTGKRIFVIFSTTFPSVNEPVFRQIVLDSVEPPANGWDSLPELKTEWAGIYTADSIP
jgi:hypothetical protein